MDFTAIGIAALIGGVSGGVGGLVVKLLGDRLPAALRGVIVAVAVGLGLLAAPLVANYFDQDRPRSASYMKGLEKGLLSTQYMREFKAEFPEDYEEFYQSLSHVKSLEVGRERGVAFGIQFRRKYADAIKTAPTETIVKYLVGRTELTKLSKAKDGDKVCAAMELVGPTGLPDGSSDYSDAIDVQAVVLMDAIVQGLKNPVPFRKEPSQEDWQALLDDWRESGATEAQIDVVLAGDGQSTLYCDAAISFSEAVLDFEGDVGDRIRIEIAYQMAIS